MRCLILGCTLLLSSCAKEKLEKNYEEPKSKPQSWCAYENFSWDSYSFNPIKAGIKNVGTNLHRYYFRVNKIDEFYNEYFAEGSLNNDEIIRPQKTGSFSYEILGSQDFLGYGIQVFPEHTGECASIDYLDVTNINIVKSDLYWDITIMVENGEKSPFNGKIKLHFTKNGKVVTIHTLNTSKGDLPKDGILPIKYIVQKNILKDADSLRVVFSDIEKINTQCNSSFNI